MENKKSIFFIVGVMVLITILAIFKKTETYAVNKTSIQNANVTLSSTSFIYSGQAKKPTVKSIKVGGKTVPSSGYTVRYVNNVKAGKGGIIITGKGNYIGTVAKEFTINKKNISNLKTGLNLNGAYTYDGKAKKPGITLNVAGKKLIYNQDFTIEYKNNVNAGTGTATIRGKGNYTGGFTRTFKINKQDISKASIAYNTYNYEGVPNLVLKIGGKELILGTDYTKSYSNKNYDNGTATVNVVGKGNYTGSFSRSITIKKGDIISYAKAIKYYISGQGSMNTTTKYDYCDLGGWRSRWNL